MEKPLVIVKSSAGSGKTFAIAKAYLNLILGNESPFHFGKILALTFTVKATAEMKERIIVYLSDLAHGSTKRSDTSYMLDALIEATGLDKEELKSRAKVRLEAILHNYDDFSIMTIDKFFHRLVRAFSSDLNLSGDFEVQIDQNQFIDAVIETVQAKIGNDEPLRNSLLEFAEYQINQNRSYVLDTHLKAVVKELISDHFFNDQSSDFHIDESEVREARSKILRKISQTEKAIESIGGEIMDLLKSEGIEMADLKGKSRGLWPKFSKIKEVDINYINKSWAAYESIPETESWQTDTKHPGVVNIQSKVSTLVQKLIDLKAEVNLSEFLRSIYPSLFAIGFVQKLLDLIEQTKTQLNIQTLGDFNRLLYAKLRNENAYFLFERLGNQFEHILIDEFQDTSVIQWNNLIPLVENSISDGKQSLIVGDGKQSIYRFRGGETAQFSKLPKIEHESSFLFEESASVELLKSNYRSARNIVDFNNRFFEEFTRERSERITSIYSGLKQEAHQSESGTVTWLFPSEYNNKSDRFPMLAKRVEHKLSEGIRAETLCCLFFKNDDARELASELNQLGIDAISEENLKAVSHPAVQLLMASQRLIANPKDSFILQHWLLRLHHFRPFDEYQHMALKVKSRELGYRELLKALKLKDALWFKPNSSVFNLLLRVAQVLDIDLTDPMVQIFLDACLEYDQQYYYKESFESYWSRVQDDLSINVPENSNAVQLMTIHKSKGLEFEHVIIDAPEISKSRLTQDHTWVELEKEIGLKMAFVETSKLEETRHHDIWDQENEASDIDFINALYVAFTRAKSSLEIISKPIEKQESILFLKNWQEWNEDESQMRFE